ncbi:hypothetical protein FIU90_13320 [Erythrobacter sp. THAF29]|nr:hypothetical protein FIU90_13320 [Erythrobacter sp. THAF29]
MLAIGYDGGLKRLPMPLGIGFGVFELHGDIAFDAARNGGHFGTCSLDICSEFLRLSGDPGVCVFAAAFHPGFKSA